MKSIIKKVLPKKVLDKLKVIYAYRHNINGIHPSSVTYNQDGLVTAHNADFMKLPRFASAYKKGEETGSWGGANIHWRAHIVCWAAELAKDLPGDFVECGVNKGGLSRTVMEYINFASMKDKKFYLLDTYQGLSEKYSTETERNNFSGAYVDCYEDVKKTFANFENAVLVKGAVPETLQEVKSDKICYLHIDMNSAVPEIAAAEFFWNKLVSGAPMVLDDYGWAGCIAQKLAFDEFAKRKNVMILALPTGQGLILKP